jgi:drug/metabolite transporter (DMT)-like permease
MVPIFVVTDEIRNLSSVDPYGLCLVIVAVLIGFGLGDTLFLKSISLIGVSRAYTIVYTFPFFTMLFAMIFLGEGFLINYVIGTIFTFLGVIIIITEKNEQSERRFWGILVALVTAVIWAISMTIVAFGLTTINTVLANTLRYPFLFLFLFLISRVWRKEGNISKKNLMFLAVSGIFGMTLGGITFLQSVQLIGVSRTTALGSSSPFWATVMAALLLKEKVTWRVVMAAILIVAGIYFLA